MSDVTQLIQAIKEKQAGAIEQLFTLVYDELRRIASQRLASEKPGQSLQATALVHEAFLRLVDGSEPPTWNSRGHFFAAAVEAMRRILIEEARKRNSQKRGGGLRRVGLDEAATLLCNDEQPDIDILALDEALASLETIAPEHTRLVKLRYFAGLSIEDAAEVLGISVATAKRQWQFARSWLYGKLQGSIPANDAHTDD
ncbi:MAG: sigma-70 family RNA polymerase sigma factor [Planctomycetes bacterium]|nr:sigma-70 family RNA polymerase sigma factor [Planctomycetota bacterium]